MTVSRTLSKSDYKAARTCDAKLLYRENGYASDTAGDAYVQMLAMGHVDCQLGDLPYHRAR